MKRLLYLIPFLLMSCSDYVKVGGTYKHGNVPEASTNYNKPQAIIPIEDVTNPTTISFWTVYLPFIILVLYITYKTFKINKNN